jgi:hypothetical protein
MALRKVATPAVRQASATRMTGGGIGADACDGAGMAMQEAVMMDRLGARDAAQTQIGRGGNHCDPATGFRMRNHRYLSFNSIRLVKQPRQTRRACMTVRLRRAVPSICAAARAA